MVSNLNLLESRRRILLATPHLELPTPANPLTFKSNMSAKLKEGKVYFTPVQEGTGDPSPDNVRPILGWDGITVTRVGKNLIPDVSSTDFWTTGWLDTSGGITPSSNPYITSDFMRVKSGDNYILHLYEDYDGGIANTWKCFGFYDKNKSFLTGQYYYTSGHNTLTVSVPANANYMRVSFTNRNRSGFPDFHFQLEFGTEVTAYEPYTETKITIPFPQTIYGGYVDLVNGEVVEEYTAVTLDGENVKVNKGGYPSTNFYGAGWVYATPSGLSTNSRKIYMCDRLPTGGSTSTVLHLEASWTGSLYYRIRVVPKSDYPDELTDKEVIDLTNEWLKTNPVTVTYPLATPIHHTIDPQVIRPLKGVNNIYSDANGNIEIKFWTH